MRRLISTARGFKPPTSPLRAMPPKTRTRRLSSTDALIPVPPTSTANVITAAQLPTFSPLSLMLLVLAVSLIAVMKLRL